MDQKLRLENISDLDSVSSSAQSTTKANSKRFLKCSSSWKTYQKPREKRPTSERGSRGPSTRIHVFVCLCFGLSARSTEYRAGFKVQTRKKFRFRLVINSSQDEIPCIPWNSWIWYFSSFLTGLVLFVMQSREERKRKDGNSDHFPSNNFFRLMPSHSGKNYKIFETLTKRRKMVICSMVSDTKLWEIIFEANFSFCSPNIPKNGTFDKFNLFITSEASFKEG